MVLAFLATTSLGLLHAESPAFLNGPPPGSEIGVNYYFYYRLGGDPVPTAFLASGTLPPGLTLDLYGGLTGTPTQVGTYTGTIQISNGISPDATQDFSIKIVRIPKPVQSYTILHRFNTDSAAGDGFSPAAPLIQGSDGNFYGTTLGGGTANGGTIFKMTANGAVTILHSFGDGSVPHDGLEPYAALTKGLDGNFYGTTYAGGSPGGYNGYGTVFKMTPDGTVTILHAFKDGSVANDGIYPFASLVQGPDGNFYGTTSAGGSTWVSLYYPGSGTAFQITPQGKMTILHSFYDGTVTDDGPRPEEGLVLGPDGNFYGITLGVNGFPLIPGTAFKMTPEGEVTTLHSFGNGCVYDDGVSPQKLILGSDGNFYGITSSGGSANVGAFFQLTPQGRVTILHSFADGSVLNDNGNPKGLVQGSDGNFYGTTDGDPSIEDGTIFKMTSQGTETILHFFNSHVDEDGKNPEGGLIQGVDGNLYGTTFGGGLDYGGIIYRISLKGAPSITSVDHATFTVGQLGAFTVTATQAPYFSATGLPSWASLDETTGILSGTPPDMQGAPFTVTLTASDGADPDASQSFTLSIQTVFDQWAASYGVSGAAAVPQKDGVPNLFKYLCDIDPSTPMNEMDRLALPAPNLAIVGEDQYLTLTYRQNAMESGITVNLQVSTDLQNWTTVNPSAPDYFAQNIGTDLLTGDPIMRLGVKTNGVAKEFIRLKLDIP